MCPKCPNSQPQLSQRHARQTSHRSSQTQQQLGWRKKKIDAWDESPIPPCPILPPPDTTHGDSAAGAAR